MLRQPVPQWSHLHQRDADQRAPAAGLRVHVRPRLRRQELREQNQLLRPRRAVPERRPVPRHGRIPRQQVL